MAKAQKTSTEAMQDNRQAFTSNDDQATPAGVGRDQERTTPDAKRSPVDPRGMMSISLGDTPGSPRIQLRRSQKYKQLQLHFDEKPDDKYLAVLKAEGWTDRTEREGIWTKQVELGQWEPVVNAERLFKEIANGIRQDRGLEPVMEGLSAA